MVVAGKISSADLAKGSNLAANAGLITKQAQSVLGMVFQKNNVFFTRWRSIQLFTFSNGPAVRKSRPSARRSWIAWTSRLPTLKARLMRLESRCRTILS